MFIFMSQTASKVGQGKNSIRLYYLKKNGCHNTSIETNLPFITEEIGGEEKSQTIWINVWTIHISFLQFIAIFADKEYYVDNCDNRGNALEEPKGRKKIMREGRSNRVKCTNGLENWREHRRRGLAQINFEFQPHVFLTPFPPFLQNRLSSLGAIAHEKYESPGNPCPLLFS